MFNHFYGLVFFFLNQFKNQETQWLSGRVLDLGLNGRLFIGHKYSQLPWH